MIYYLAANLLVLSHLAFILFALFGGLLAFRWRWLPLLQLPAALWSAGIEFYGWVCPLTPMEQALWQAAGKKGYSEGFIEHYLLPVLYPANLDWDLRLVLLILVIVINGLVYSALAFNYWRRKHPAND